MTEPRGDWSKSPQSHPQHTDFITAMMSPSQEPPKEQRTPRVISTNRKTQFTLKKTSRPSMLPITRTKDTDPPRDSSQLHPSPLTSTPQTTTGTDDIITPEAAPSADRVQTRPLLDLNEDLLTIPDCGNEPTGPTGTVKSTLQNKSQQTTVVFDRSSTLFTHRWATCQPQQHHHSLPYGGPPDTPTHIVKLKTGV